MKFAAGSINFMLQQLKVRHYLKITIGIILLVALIYQFAQLEFGTAEWALLQSSFYDRWWLLLLAFLLMPLNWLCECWKWLLCMRSKYTLDIKSVIRSVLMGVSVSLITPNRMGEYLGRVAGIEPDQRGAGVITTLLGGLAQNLVTWSLGISAAIYFLNQYSSLYESINVNYLYSLGLLIPFGYGAYFYPKVIQRLVGKLLPNKGIFGKIQHALEILEAQQKLMLLRVLLLSLLRYLTYTLQYVLLLYLLGVHCTLLECLFGISLIFFIQASIPLPAALGIVMRGNISVLVWGSICGAPVAGLAASYLLFIINFSLTSFLGVYYFFQSKLRFK